MTGPLTPDELEALRLTTTPTVCNAIETFDVRPRTEGFMDSTIICRFQNLGPTVGNAVTARVRASSPTAEEVPHESVWAEFAKTPKPWIVVVEDSDYPHPVGSYWGEVNLSVYQALGAIGCITNGGVRDLAEARRLGFHFFSSCVLVSHACVRVIEVGGPVNVGGLTVRPGDLLHGDEHGVTSIPLEVAHELPEAVRRVEEAERRLIDYAQSAKWTRGELERMYGRVD